MLSNWGGGYGGTGGGEGKGFLPFLQHICDVFHLPRFWFHSFCYMNLLTFQQLCIGCFLVQGWVGGGWFLPLLQHTLDDIFHLPQFYSFSHMDLLAFQ